MTDSEMIQKIYNELKAFKDEMHEFKDEMHEFKDEMHEFKDEMNEFKDEMHEFKDEMYKFKDEVHEFKDEMYKFKDEMHAFRDETKQELADVHNEINDLKCKVTCMQLILENETNRNIQIIAEGHLDITRKLNEIISRRDSEELNKVRLNVLEGEVNRLKQQVQPA